MHDLDYLNLLSKSFPTKEDALAEIINLSAIMELPKGTEYFLSDVHGEYEAFSYLLRSSSGVIPDKIHRLLGKELTPEGELELTNLVCYPREVLSGSLSYKKPTKQKETINRLVRLASMVSSKYTRSKVRKKMPYAYGYVLDELMHTNADDLDKSRYHEAILDAICENGGAEGYIIALCELIQSLAIDHLHIVGDIYDRGPRPDKIMDDLIKFQNVDIEWGNHDVSWIGASLGNLACICNVLHIATLYNSFDVLEDGYGINLRPLSMYAKEVYRDDPCTRFQPHLLDENVSDSIEPELAAKMCKAISVLLFKLEGQLIKRHPEYGMGERLLLDKVNWGDGTITLKGKTYPMLDCHLPTMDPTDPRALTPREKKLLEGLRYSFTHSERLRAHMEFVIEKGGIYKVFNGNLLTHGCVLLDENGDFLNVETPEGYLSGKALMDYYDREVRRIFYADNRDGENEDTDLFWYLWCGANSPLFGKDQITTFERTFIADKSLYRETYNPYYAYSNDPAVVEKVLVEFGCDPKRGHIINGHVPVLVQQGESPVKANGKLFKIDGGLAKAYQAKTGIAGYSLIFNSHHLAIAEHNKFEKFGRNTSSVVTVEEFPARILVKDTDVGARLRKERDDLQELIQAYDACLIKQKPRKK